MTAGIQVWGQGGSCSTQGRGVDLERVSMIRGGKCRGQREASEGWLQSSERKPMWPHQQVILRKHISHWVEFWWHKSEVASSLSPKKVPGKMSEQERVLLESCILYSVLTSSISTIIELIPQERENMIVQVGTFLIAHLLWRTLLTQTFAVGSSDLGNPLFQFFPFCSSVPIPSAYFQKTTSMLMNSVQYSLILRLFWGKTQSKVSIVLTWTDCETLRSRN